MEKLVTIIIPFLNEGKEPSRTINNIQKTAFIKNVDFIVIDDCSDKKLDLKKKFPFIKLIRNKKRIGSHNSRDYAISLATTKLILWLDAHMRFPTKKWLQKMIKISLSEPKTIFCTASANFQRTMFSYRQKGSLKYGATLNLFKLSYRRPAVRELLEGRWNLIEPINEVSVVPCLMGANYIFHKEFYLKLGGLKGLEMWGCTEPYLSIKAYLSGGRCKIIKNITILHKYRRKAPYTTTAHYIYFNKLFVAKVLFPDKLFKRFIDLLDDSSYEFIAAKALIENKDLKIKEIKHNLNKNNSKTLTDFIFEYS